MKKVMTAVLAAAMCLSMAVGAMADGIQPRSPSCDVCGGSTYIDIIDEEYVGEKYVACNKDPQELDYFPVYEITAEYVCSQHGTVETFTYTQTGARVCEH